MNGIDPSAEFLAVVLSPHGMPTVIELSTTGPAAQGIWIADAHYVDSGAGDWLGFYDWLRSPLGDVIGVRQWIDDVTAFPFSTRFEGVEADPRDGVLRVFFGPSREIDEDNSCDQDFGNNRLLVSGDSIALTFQAPSVAANPPR